MKYTCPVCGWPELDEPPYDDTGWGSFEICSCCGIEFGYDQVTETLANKDFAALCEGTWSKADLDFMHASLREKWVFGGMKWWSEYNPAPENWNPGEQLRQLLFKQDTANAQD